MLARGRAIGHYALMTFAFIRKLRAMREGGFSAKVEKVIPFGEPNASARVTESIAAVGRLTRSQNRGEIGGSVRYGLAHARVAATLDAVDANSTRLTLSAFGEDACAVGARSAVARIFDAVDRLDNPRYHPNRFGPKLVNTAVQLTLFCALLAGGLYVWLSLTH